MPFLSTKSALIVGINQTRRRKLSDRLREAGAVVVEAMTVPQAEAAMRQLRFEFIFVDFLGAGVGMLGFFENARAEDREAHVFVVGPSVNCHPSGKLQSSDLTKLGFGNTPECMDDVLSAAFEQADGLERMGGYSPVAAPSGATKSNGRQK